MAKGAVGSITFKKKATSKRPGVHAKTKTSKNKGAQNYQKPYAKQGR